MKIENFLNLKRVLIGLIFLSFLPPFIFLIVNQYLSLKEVLYYQKKDIRERIENILITNKIDSIYTTLKLISTHPAIKNLRQEEGEKVLLEAVKNTDFLYNLALLDTNGNLVISALPVDKKINAADRLYFKRVMEKKDFVAGGFAISRTTGKPTIHLAFPILDEANNIKAILLAIPHMKKIMPNINESLDGAIITDEKGVIVVSNKEEEIGKIFEDFSLINKEESSSSYTKGGFLISFASLRVNNIPILYLISKTPLKKRFAYGMVIILFMFAITVFSALYLARRLIYDPLIEIGKSFENFDIERAGIRIEKKYFGEIGVFAESSNKFSKIIEQDAKMLISEKKFWEDTFNAYNDPLYLVDVDFKVIRANDSFFKIFGVEREKLGQIHCFEIVHQLDFPIDYCPHKTVISNHPSFSEEVFLPSVNKWFLITITPLLNDKKELIGSLHIFKDVTAIKQSEEERLKIERQLLHTQKLESLGVLAGGIAHDFNNILMGILGNAELALMKKDNLSEDVIYYLQTIKTVTEKAAHLTRQMLAYSGKGKFILREIELNSYIKEIFDLIKVSISKKAVIHLNLDETKPLIIKGDPGQIEQIIMNLVINASEAIEDKEGLITISTGRQWCDKKYFERSVDGASEYLEEGEYVYFEVTDMGIGMDKETMQKIFEPFFTTKFTGRGLGLSAILGIVRGHNGAIMVYSEKGKGSSFKILLPAFNPPGELEKAIKEEEEKSFKVTALIVDDEEIVRGVAKSMIEAMGGKAIVVKEGKDAIEIYKNMADSIDFVLLDLTMPGLSGDEVFRELKKIRADVKVILMSGYNDQEISQRLVGKGIASFIQKPFTFDGLKEKIKGILATSSI